MLLKNAKKFYFIYLIILINIIFIISEPLIDFPRWYSKSKPENASNYKNIKDYLKVGSCQSITNKCKEIPKYPYKRSHHTSITYHTYSQQEANELCPDNYCGPFCNYTSDSCNSTTPYPDYPTVTIFELINFVGPLSNNCPAECCLKTNEYCYRLINNAGNEVYPDQEIMLVFGGLVLNKVKFEINGVEQDVMEGCNNIIEGVNSMGLNDLSTEENFNLLYLINNCGYEMSNDIWEYNINKDSWTFVKPYIESTTTTQQKPYPRYGHSAVYVEISNTGVNGEPFIRKYMYIYGGYSLYCQHSCEDMWSYEIAYGPQRFYPDSSYYAKTSESNIIWEKGNKWNRIYPVSYNSPGKRALHAMTVDSNYTYIYLYGGYSVDETTLSNVLMDDLWRYNIKQNTWDQLNPAGIYSITRSITYWDGSSAILNISAINYDQTTDTIYTSFQNKKETTAHHGSFPVIRAAASLTYNQRKDGTEYLLLFGGITYNITSIYNIQYQLNDLWIYTISQNSWLEVFPNGELPGARYGHAILAVEEDMFILYGGIGISQIYNDLWIYNSWSNLWVQTNKEGKTAFDYSKSNEKWPYPAGFFTMNFFENGIIIYGGYIWKQTNESVMNFYLSYKDEEPLFKNSLFAIVENLYILYSYCPLNCSNKGECHLGLCFCNDGFWGDGCQNKNCPKDFCFSDHDFHIKQECFQCSGNGECLSNGTCKCNKEYTGDDCSIRECLNNCSGEKYGKCIKKKPISVCECNQELKRGGDDCSLIFCLNNCGKQGECNKTVGECSCNKNYYGEDCSVYVIDFREYSPNYFGCIKKMILFFIIFIYI